MKKLYFILLIIIILSSCNRGNFRFNWENVNSIIENSVFSFIDQEKIYFTEASSWGTTDNNRNLDLLRISIIFNKGYWNDSQVYNDIIENEILNKVYNTISKLNRNKNILSFENIEITPFFPFRIISPVDIIVSKDDIEIIEELLWYEFKIIHVFNIHGNYCEGYIHNKVNIDKFINFMKIYLGNNIIIEI